MTNAIFGSYCTVQIEDEEPKTVSILSNVLEVMKMYVIEKRQSFIIEYTSSGYHFRAINGYGAGIYQRWKVFIDGHLRSEAIDQINVKAYQKVNIRLVHATGPYKSLPPPDYLPRRLLGQVRIFVLTYSPIDVPLYSGNSIIDVLQTAFVASELTFMLEYDGSQVHPKLTLKAIDGIISQSGPGWVTSVGIQENMKKNVALDIQPSPGDTIIFSNENAPDGLLPSKNK